MYGTHGLQLLASLVLSVVKQIAYHLRCCTRSTCLRTHILRKMQRKRRLALLPKHPFQIKRCGCQDAWWRFCLSTVTKCPGLNGLDLSVQLGQFCALVGPSSARKVHGFLPSRIFLHTFLGYGLPINRSITTTTTPPHRSSI